MTVIKLPSYMYWEHMFVVLPLALCFNLLLSNLNQLAIPHLLGIYVWSTILVFYCLKMINNFPGYKRVEIIMPHENSCITSLGSF